MRILISILVSCVVLLSCIRKKAMTESEQLLRDFDSVSRSLKKVNRSVAGSSVMYDSLVSKLATNESGSIRQMYYQVHDFYGYVADLKMRFYKFCGDTSGTAIPEWNTDDIELTNSFFSTAPATYLLSQLLETKKQLLANASSDSLRNRIKSIGSLNERKSSYSAEYWRNKYFKNAPPVAAVTILNSFEVQIKSAEFIILQEYFKQ